MFQNVSVQQKNPLCVWRPARCGTLATASASPPSRWATEWRISKVKMVVKGDNKPISALTLATNRKTFYTEASDGTIISWDSESGRNNRIEGPGHGNQVVGIAVSGNTSLNTIGTFDSTTGQYGGAAVSLSAQPRGIEQHGDLTFLVTLKSIVMLKGGSVEQEIGVEFEPSCCSYSSSHQHLAVGEVSGNTVRIYSTNAGMDLVKEITLTGATMDVAYSPDQKYLVTADSNRKVESRSSCFNFQIVNYPGDLVLCWWRI